MAKGEIASSQKALLAMTRLDVSHMPKLEELYAYGGGDAFRQRSLELGVFYGVFDDERLVSVAGTHIVSECERIAALGNVMTHPAYRGRGLATMATGAVCDELLDRGIEMIGLSVSRSNEAAIRVYEKIGFNRHVPFYEGTAVRKADT
jgi:predicted GNAT family acetyltransferase